MFLTCARASGNVSERVFEHQPGHLVWLVGSTQGIFRSVVVALGATGTMQRLSYSLVPLRSFNPNLFNNSHPVVDEQLKDYRSEEEVHPCQVPTHISQLEGHKFLKKLTTTSPKFKDTIGREDLSCTFVPSFLPAKAISTIFPVLPLLTKSLPLSLLCK